MDLGSLPCVGTALLGAPWAGARGEPTALPSRSPSTVRPGRAGGPLPLSYGCSRPGRGPQDTAQTPRRLQVRPARQDGAGSHLATAPPPVSGFPLPGQGAPRRPPYGVLTACTSQEAPAAGACCLAGPSPLGEGCPLLLPLGPPPEPQEACLSEAPSSVLWVGSPAALTGPGQGQSHYPCLPPTTPHLPPPCQALKHRGD